MPNNFNNIPTSYNNQLLDPATRILSLMKEDNQTKEVIELYTITGKEKDSIFLSWLRNVTELLKSTYPDPNTWITAAPKFLKDDAKRQYHKY